MGLGRSVAQRAGRQGSERERPITAATVSKIDPWGVLLQPTTGEIRSVKKMDMAGCDIQPLIVPIPETIRTIVAAATAFSPTGVVVDRGSKALDGWGCLRRSSD